MERTRGKRHAGLIAAALIAGMLLALSLASSGRVFAQQDPACEDPETVACIPVSGSQAPTTGAAGASGAAAAAPAPAAAGAPAAPRPPCVLPGPPYPPYPGPYPLPAAAAPGPVPPIAYLCFDDIFSTINRANLAYARSMRSADASQLFPYWGQDALQQLLGQISALRVSNSYRVLRLASIDLLEQEIYLGYAWVHTTEHWITATWSYSGYLIDGNDAWYDNQYYLYRSGNRWIIGTDVVN